MECEVQRMKTSEIVSLPTKEDERGSREGVQSQARVSLCNDQMSCTGVSSVDISHWKQ